jgi:hypothetical protein
MDVILTRKIIYNGRYYSANSVLTMPDADANLFISKKLVTAKTPLVVGRPNTTNVALTLNDVKSDPDISGAIRLKHSNLNDHAPGSDNQEIPTPLTQQQIEGFI